jgi:CRP-like cAMP-binding protein
MEQITQLIQQIQQGYLWDETLALARNSYLKTAGQIDTNLYFVVSGSFKLFVLNENEEHLLRFGYKDNFIAALESFITEQPTDLYIQAIKKAEVKSISKRKFMSLVHASPETTRVWEQLLEQLILQQMERERDLLTSSPLERYKRVLKRSPQLFQEIPHKHIAAYLKMTPETLSRMKKS